MTTEEEEVLWTSGQLGDSNLMYLVNTFWWSRNIFGMWRRQQHHSTTTEHFRFKKSDQGMAHVTFFKGITKTPQNRLHDKHQMVIPKMFATDTARCPVCFFKLYLSR